MTGKKRETKKKRSSLHPKTSCFRCVSPTNSRPSAPVHTATPRTQTSIRARRHKEATHGRANASTTAQQKQTTPTHINSAQQMNRYVPGALFRRIAGRQGAVHRQSDKETRGIPDFFFFLSRLCLSFPTREATKKMIRLGGGGGGVVLFLSVCLSVSSTLSSASVV